MKAESLYIWDSSPTKAGSEWQIVAVFDVRAKKYLHVYVLMGEIKS